MLRKSNSIFNVKDSLIKCKNINLINLVKNKNKIHANVFVSLDSKTLLCDTVETYLIKD
jgi:hypothetical protein